MDIVLSGGVWYAAEKPAPMAGITPTLTRLFRFGLFELDVRSGELRKQGIRIKLREQPIRILLLLLDHPGEVVLREEIRLKGKNLLDKSQPLR